MVPWVSGQLFQSGLFWLELNGHMSGMAGMIGPTRCFILQGDSLGIPIWQQKVF